MNTLLEIIMGVFTVIGAFIIFIILMLLTMYIWNSIVMYIGINSINPNIIIFISAITDLLIIYLLRNYV